MCFTKIFLVIFSAALFYIAESLSALEGLGEASAHRLTVFDPVVGLPYYGDGSQAEVHFESVGKNLPKTESANWCVFEPQAFERRVRKKKAMAGSSSDAPVEQLPAHMLVPQAHSLIPESCVVEAEHKLIPNPHVDGWGSIGHLEMQLCDPMGNVVRTYIGTAQLIGPHTLLTAGHNLWSRALKTGFSRIIFHPGRMGDSVPYVAQASSFIVHPGYISGEEEEYQRHDIGVIVLDTPLGYKVGWSSYGHLEDHELISKMLSIVGYPSIVYQDGKPTMVNGTQMFHMAGQVIQLTETQIYYGINTFGGHSGSGVVDEDRCIRAIHTYGGTKETGNCGTRISRDIEGRIKEWVDQFAADPASKASPAFQTRRATALARRLVEEKTELSSDKKAPVKLKEPLKRLQKEKKMTVSGDKKNAKPMKKQKEKKRKSKKQ